MIVSDCTLRQLAEPLQRLLNKCPTDGDPFHNCAPRGQFIATDSSVKKLSFTFRFPENFYPAAAPTSKTNGHEIFRHHPALRADDLALR